jgi:anion-transporting  ArsA/GET3 family ATPase
MITVYFGTRGAGKTSVAAATAFARAHAGLKCLLLTGGAAAPLGAALGLKGVAHEHRVAADGAGRGELWAALLDTRATLDEAVRLYSVPRDRDRILRHPIYRALPDSLSGLTELMTIERIDQARRRGFEDIVIDTAPSRQALSLLDKPVLFAEFAGSNWVKLIGRTYQFAEGLGMLAFGRKTVDTYGRVESMLGSKLVREVLDFYSLFTPVAEAYATRAQRIAGLLRDSDLRLVSTPAKARRDLRFFTKGLDERGLRLSRVVVNRIWEPEPAAGGEVADWYRCVKAEQACELSALREEFSDVRTVTELPHTVDGLDSLAALAGQLS